MSKTAKSEHGARKPKSHARFLRYASLHSVNADAATITPERAAAIVRGYLETEAAH